MMILRWAVAAAVSTDFGHVTLSGLGPGLETQTSRDIVDVSVYRITTLKIVNGLEKMKSIDRSWEFSVPFRGVAILLAIYRISRGCIDLAGRHDARSSPMHHISWLYSRLDAR